MQKRMIGLLVVSIVALVGCDKTNKMIENMQDSVRNSLQEKQDAVVAKSSPSKAVDHFISCANRLSRSVSVRANGSMSVAFAIYQKQNLGKANAKTGKRADAIYSPDAMKDCIEDLTEGTKLELAPNETKYTPVLNSAKALLLVLPPFQKTVEEMESYLKTKKFVDDDFKHGQELDALYMQQAPPFIEAYNNFDEALSELDNIRTHDMANSLVKNNKLRAGYGYQAYADIMDFISVLDHTDDPTKPEVAQKLDDLIKATEDSLNKMKEAMDKTQDKKSSNLKDAYDALLGLLGDMRDLKTSKFSQSSYKRLIDDYNRFVQFTLDFGRLRE